MTKSLGSRYVLAEALGRGAMGQVFAGSIRPTGEPVAIKILRPELVSDPEIVVRFVQERTILTSINDPHVVRVIDLVVEGDTLAIVMELVHGPDLRRHLLARRTVPPAEALHLTGQLLRGMAAVHAAGTVHRDIKPENVLVDTSSGQTRLKLTDFGVARLSYGGSLTRLTGVIGTPEYMAPELAEHNRATPAADIYSAGIVLYEMLCGRTPFAGGHPLAVLRRQADQAPPVIPGVPAELWDRIAWMLAKDPGSRPASAAQAHAALASLEAPLASWPALAPWHGPEAATLDRTTSSAGQPVPADHAGPEPLATVLRHRDRGEVPAPGGTGGLAPQPSAANGPGGRWARLAPASRRARAAVLAVAVAAVLGLVTTVAMAGTHHGSATLRPAADGRTATPRVTASSAEPSASAQTTGGPSAASVSTAGAGAASGPLVAPADGTGQTTPPVVIETAGGSSTSNPQPAVTVTSTVTSTATSTASLNAAEQQLMNSLNSRIFDDCTSSANELSVNTLAAINCTATTGPPSRPLAETLAPGHAETWFQNNTRGYTNSNDCAGGSYLGTWSHDGSVAGQLGCGLGANGVLRIVWTIDDNQIGIIAQGSDGQALHTWWTLNACAVPAAC
jgi:serine/threonine protein kinase, bacterial